jgi:acetyltransferase-like isoleucine patch superfamily enzyme
VAVDHTHAFAGGVLYPVEPHTNGSSFFERLRTEFVRRLMKKLEKERAAAAVSSFLSGTEASVGVRIGSTAWCHNPSSQDHVRIGESAICRGIIRIENFKPGHVVIGAFTYMGDDCILSCAERIEIGRYTMLAHGVQVFDNDSHPINATERQHDYLILLGHATPPRPPIATAPIIIGEHVWIGLESIILKGVRIGDNSIIAAGSVVTRDIPANVIAAGNPARVVRQIAVSELSMAEAAAAAGPLS